MAHESNATLVTIDPSTPPTSRRLKRELGWTSDFSFAKRRAVASASPPTPSPRTTTDGPEFNSLPHPRAQPVLHYSPEYLQTIDEDGLYEAKEDSTDFTQAGYSYTPHHPTKMMSPLHHQPRPSPKPKKHPKPETLDLSHRAPDRLWSLHSGDLKQSPGSPGTIHLELAQLREHLRSLGSVYLGNLEAADVYMQAVALRRNWTPASPIKEERQEVGDHPPAADRPEFGEDIVVRARVRPRDDHSKPFVIQRRFNLAEMRATIPDPTPEGHTLQRRSSIADLANRPYSPTTPVGTKPLIGRERRRSTSVRFGPLSPASPRTRRGPIGAGVELKLPPRNSNNLMPIRKDCPALFFPFCSPPPFLSWSLFRIVSTTLFLSELPLFLSS